MGGEKTRDLKSAITCGITPVVFSGALLDFSPNSCPDPLMTLKFCSKCAYKLLLSSSLADPLDPKSKTRSTCIKCGVQDLASKNKRKALKSLDPNIPSTRRTIARVEPTEAPSTPSPMYDPERAWNPLYVLSLYPNHVRKPLCSPLLYPNNLLYRLLNLPLLSSSQASCWQINGSWYRTFILL